MLNLLLLWDSEQQDSNPSTPDSWILISRLSVTRVILCVTGEPHSRVAVRRPTGIEVAIEVDLPHIASR